MILKFFDIFLKMKDLSNSDAFMVSFFNVFFEQYQYSQNPLRKSCSAHSENCDKWDE